MRWLVLIGVASTAGRTPLYWELCHWDPPPVADLASLLAISVLSTEANRRPAFRGSPVRAVQAHLAAGVPSVPAYPVTTEVAPLFHHYRPTASPTAETLVLVPGFAPVTCCAPSC
ncbi:hypothetical protein ACFC0C_22110 [Streptomyces sp. NPDC056178]|uniref:hypothetical protein n=1 Tax=unclassified Streptomyces TaxID=2593676 RepID=UPI0035DEB52B